MKNKIYLLLVFLVTLVIAATHKHDFPRFLVGFEIMLATALYFSTKVMKKQVNLLLKTAGTTVKKKESFAIKLVLENHGIAAIPELRVRIGCTDVLSGQTQYLRGNAMLDSNGKAVLRFVIAFDHCGPVRLWLDQVSVTDYLGVFTESWKQHSESAEIAVIPDEGATIERIQSSFAEGAINAEDSSYTQKGSDPLEVFEIRPYREGDKLQRIHWKMFAKMGELLVREMGQSKERYAVLFLDLKKDKEFLSRNEWDHFLELVAACTHQMVRARLPHFLCWLDGTEQQLVKFWINSETDMEQMLALLVGACAYDSGDIEDFYQELNEDTAVAEFIRIDLHGTITWGQNVSE